MKSKTEKPAFENDAFVSDTANGILSDQHPPALDSMKLWIEDEKQMKITDKKTEEIEVVDEKLTTKGKKPVEQVEEEKEEEEDPWSLPELKSTETPWEDLSPWQRVRRVLWYVCRLVILLGLLYLFICSLDILSSAFRLLGGQAAGEAMSNTVLFQNPIAGVMLGVLVTLLVQSSSTSTSIVVSMVSADLLPVHLAIPIIMGTNIGTTVTNTIVAMGQSNIRGDFRRAFAAATVHDMFNWLSVLVFLPLEWSTRYLARLTEAITSNIHYNVNDTSSSDNPEFLKALTNPLTEKIVVLSSSKIRDIALGLDVNGSLITEGDHAFSDWDGSDAAAGGILLAGSLLVLCVCLVLIVKTLSSLLKGAIATLLQRFINSDLPGPLGKHLTGYLAILVGAGMTILVQSSSIFTSAITPLVGMGAIHIDRMYPLTLGSNLGTTVTGILAALASDPVGFKNSIQVALSHLFFNVSGILVWYPIPFLRRIPIKMAKALGQTVFHYRWFAPVYLVLLYALMPVAIFGLSLAGWEVLLGVALPIVVLIVGVVVISLLQDRKPHLLHPRIRSWEALGVPEPLRSLAPYDRLLTRVLSVCTCCRKPSPTQVAAAAEEGAEEMGMEEVSDNTGEKERGGLQNQAFVKEEEKGAAAEHSAARKDAGTNCEPSCSHGWVENKSAQSGVVGKVGHVCDSEKSGQGSAFVDGEGSEGEVEGLDESLRENERSEMTAL